MSYQLFTDILKGDTPPQEKPIEKTDNTQTFNIMKTDDDKRLIFGWASVAIRKDGEQIVDHQNDMIDPDDLEEAVYEYVLEFRDGGEEHIGTLRKKAKMVESCMFTKEKMQAMGIPEGIVPEGWWIGFYVEDDDAWEKVKDGTYQMFSVEGQGIREEVEDEIGKSSPEERPSVSPEDISRDISRDIPSIAKTFNEILESEDIEKFNPYHGSDGRFASADGYASFTFAPGKSKAHDMAIAREKERVKAGGAAGGAGAKEEEKGHAIAEGKDLTKTMSKDATIEEVLKAQGFDGPPKIETNLDEFKKISDANGNIAVRSLDAMDEKLLDVYEDQLKHGDFYVECSGGNAMGRGMYMATSWNGMYEYAFMDSAPYGPKHINMTLDKSAKIIHKNDIIDMAQKEGFNSGAWSSKNTIDADIGAFAAAKGYDAIMTGGSYTCVLNRTKLTIYDTAGDLRDMSDEFVTPFY